MGNDPLSLTHILTPTKRKKTHLKDMHAAAVSAVCVPLHASPHVE